MDIRDRMTIDRYCDEIVPAINMTRLWPELIISGVFNPDDVNVPEWENDLDQRTTVHDILMTIKTRGPYAFDNLISSLRKTGHEDEADVLQGRMKSAPKHNQNNNNELASEIETEDGPINDNFHESLQKSDQPLQIKLRKATEFLDGPKYDTIGNYRMRSKPRGYVLIITIISYSGEDKRTAAELDESNLKKLFEDMGFEVTSVKDLTGEQIKNTIRDFSRKDFRHIDSCFVIISAHGAETKEYDYPSTEIHGTDYKMQGATRVMCTDIIDAFCIKQLDRIPKVFIFQSCRGRREQFVTENARDAKDGSQSIPSRKYSDILVVHSTLPGHYAYRDTVNGSWYIQTLCEVFMNHAWKLHLTQMLQLVDRRMENYRTYSGASQTSTVKSMGFNRQMYINPGLFEDS